PVDIEHARHRETRQAIGRQVSVIDDAARADDDERTRRGGFGPALLQIGKLAGRARLRLATCLTSFLCAYSFAIRATEARVVSCHKWPCTDRPGSTPMIAAAKNTRPVSRLGRMPAVCCPLSRGGNLRRWRPTIRPRPGYRAAPASSCTR